MWINKALQAYKASFKTRFMWGQNQVLCYVNLIVNQREGMALLEYQAMTSLHDIAHDVVLCTCSNRPAPHGTDPLPPSSTCSEDR
jgi:hypothetical protein